MIQVVQLTRRRDAACIQHHYRQVVMWIEKKQQNLPNAAFSNFAAFTASRSLLNRVRITLITS
jgi:hypothetical protein